MSSLKSKARALAGRGKSPPAGENLSASENESDQATFKLDPEGTKRDALFRPVVSSVLITAVLMVASMTSFFVMRDAYVLELERDVADYDRAMFSATLVTGSISLCIFSTWFMAFSRGTRLLTASAGWGNSLVLIFFTSAVLLASSLMNVLSMLSIPAMARFIVAAVSVLSHTTNLAQSSLIDTLAFLNSSAGIERAACAGANAERNGGLASGTGPGYGPATSAFNSACETVRGLRSTMAEQIEVAKPQFDAISDKIMKLRFIVDDRNQTLVDREQELRRVQAELEMLLRSFRSTGLQKSVEGGVSQLANAVIPVDESSGFPKGTITAINSLATQMQAASKSLEEVRAKGEKATAFVVPERASLYEMVQDYSAKYPSQVAQALFLDAWPLYTFWMIILYNLGMPNKPRHLLKTPSKSTRPTNRPDRDQAMDSAALLKLLKKKGQDDVNE